MAEGMLRPVPQGASYPSLAGKKVIISGGGSGIGEGIVEGFVRQGAAVAFVDIEAELSKALVARLGDAEVPPIFSHCDITRSADYTARIEELIGRLGGCDVLVNNAANDDRHKVEEVTELFGRLRHDLGGRHQPGPHGPVAPLDQGPCLAVVMVGVGEVEGEVPHVVGVVGNVAEESVGDPEVLPTGPTCETRGEPLALGHGDGRGGRARN